MACFRSPGGAIKEDNQERMILKPHNNSVTFAGGVGDPSAVASGDYLYIFYGEYGYPGTYDRKAYSADKEQSGQCISMARIKLTDLDNPTGKAKRYDGKGFQANYDGVGSPIKNIQISKEEGGGPSSVSSSKYYWGPSVHKKWKFINVGSITASILTIIITFTDTILGTTHTIGR